MTPFERFNDTVRASAVGVPPLLLEREPREWRALSRQGGRAEAGISKRRPVMGNTSPRTTSGEGGHVRMPVPSREGATRQAGVMWFFMMTLSA
jgi:hypothetical protein